MADNQSPVTGFAPGSGAAPILINYTIDGSQVPQPITQTVDINITGTAGNVINSPYVVKLTAKFVEPPFQAVPAGAAASYYPCQDPLDESVMNFTVTGRPGSAFYAGVIPGLVTDSNSLAGETFLAQRAASGNLDLMNAAGIHTEIPLVLPAAIDATNAITFTSNVGWVTAMEADKNTVPATLSVTISPTLRTADFDVAALILIGESFTPNEPFIVRAYGIELMCAESSAWLPLIKTPQQSPVSPDDELKRSNKQAVQRWAACLLDETLTKRYYSHQKSIFPATGCMPDALKIRTRLDIDTTESYRPVAERDRHQPQCIDPDRFRAHACRCLGACVLANFSGVACYWSWQHSLTPWMGRWPDTLTRRAYLVRFLTAQWTAILRRVTLIALIIYYSGVPDGRFRLSCFPSPWLAH